MEVEVEVKEEENEIREDEEPPRKRGRRRKDDKSPRLPKRRKSLQSSMSVVRWKDVELFLLTLAIYSTTLNTNIC